MASSDDRAIDDVIAAMRNVLARGREAGNAGADMVTSGVDDAVRALVTRRVERAMRTTSGTVDASHLAAALEPSRSISSLAGRAGNIGGRMARHTRTARALSRRTPAGMALRWGPVLVDVVRSNLQAVDAVAEHLVSRTRRAGVDPDPERVEAVVVQVLSGAELDPDAGPDHSALARAWLRDSGRRLLPFGLGRAGERRPAAEVVGILAELDVGRLGRR